jgi:hypothetical protein
MALLSKYNGTKDADEMQMGREKSSARLRKEFKSAFSNFEF